MSTKVAVSCTDQKLTITSQPLIASGGVQEDVIEFGFCPLWDGFEKTAAFWRNEREVYHVVLVDDRCVIPKEVTLTPGVFLFGVFGIKDDVIRTTEAVKYPVAQGAYTAGSGKIPKPTPNVYEQIMAAIGTKITSPSVGRVGQALVVKAVDENGKPTEWVAVDMASGGGGLSSTAIMLLISILKAGAYYSNQTSNIAALEAVLASGGGGSGGGSDDGNDDDGNGGDNTGGDTGGDNTGGDTGGDDNTGDGGGNEPTTILAIGDGVYAVQRGKVLCIVPGDDTGIAVDGDVVSISSGVLVHKNNDVLTIY